MIQIKALRWGFWIVPNYEPFTHKRESSYDFQRTSFISKVGTKILPSFSFVNMSTPAMKKFLHMKDVGSPVSVFPLCFGLFIMLKSLGDLGRC